MPPDGVIPTDPSALSGRSTEGALAFGVVVRCHPFLP